MGIADERRMAELRYRQQRNRMLFRAVFFMTSLLPAALIALNFEAFRQYAIVALGGRPEPVVQEARASQVPAPVVVPDRPRQQRPPIVATPRPVQQPRIAQIEPRRETRRPTVVRKQPVPESPPEPDFKIVLNLTRQRHRFPVDSPSRMRVLPFTSLRCTMEPSDGSFDDGKPLTITFSEPFNPRIIVSVDQSTIWVNYQVESLSGRLVPFTTTNLKTVQRRITKSGKQLVATVHQLENEQARLQAYLGASGGKLWNEKKQATTRSKELPRLIAAAKRQITTLESELNTTDRLLRLAESIDGAELHIVVEDGEAHGG